MKNTKFTKGEWNVKVSKDMQEGTCSYVILNDDNRPEAQTFEGGIANANLIASAPEMYHLLESISILTEGCHGVDTNEIDKLLAKARGE